MEIKISDIQSGANTVNNGLQTARLIKSNMGKSSLTRRAKDTVFQYPLLIESSIDSDEIMVMSRALERQYASLLVSWMSLDAGVDINKYENLGNYLKKFHSNSDIPANIQASKIMMESANTLEEVDYKHELSGLGNACWDNDVTSKIVTESVNDISRPYDRTKFILESNLEKMKIAKESIASNLNDPRRIKDENRRISAGKFGGLNSGGNTSYGDIKFNPKTKTYDPVMVKDPKTGEMVQHKITRTSNGTIQMSNKNSITKPNEKLSSLEPTMINCTFIMHGGEGNNTQWTQNIILGVKCMIRTIRPEFMVSNMADAAKNSNFIFKFIKWTKGEYHLVDALFGVSEEKDKALNSKNDPSHWWKALRRRKSINNITRLFEQGRVLPSSTIIMTAMSVQRVFELTGVDLSQEYNAMKLLSKYYLLGFGIYDQSTGILSTIFDGDTDGFSDVTLASLKGYNEKSVDLMTDRQVKAMMGR